MSVRRFFILTLMAFAMVVSAAGGYLAWREASAAVESELDTRAHWVAGAAAATGLQASMVAGLEPGFEDAVAWTSTHFRLRRLQLYVPESYIVAPDNTALVSSHPADSVPIGAPLRFLDQFTPELERAREVGYATTRGFRGSDGRLYKWGFAQLEQSELVLAVLMPADFLAPLAKLRRQLIIYTGIAALLAAFLAGLLATGIVEPVERLSRVALRIQRGHMAEPVALEPGLELGRLSRAMERMRQGIQHRDEQLRLMLAQVAHEIRNPLGGLELFASAAGESDDPEERRHLLSRIRSEVAALNAIIDDFLTFARPMTPSQATGDLRPALREAAELVQGELGRNGGRLHLELPPDAIAARVDADHAKRAALNLLRNAAHVAENVTLRAWVERGEVVVSVADDGPGVPEALRDRIFDPFVTDKEQGAGLGLAIVRKVAEANGGRVELHRTGADHDARGSEFRIYFGSLDDPPSAPDTEGS